MFLSFTLLQNHSNRLRSSGLFRFHIFHSVQFHLYSQSLFSKPSTRVTSSFKTDKYYKATGEWQGWDDFLGN